MCSVYDMWRMPLVSNDAVLGHTQLPFVSSRSHGIEEQPLLNPVKPSTFLKHLGRPAGHTEPCLPVD